jgi:hypothetical protein
MRDMRDRLLTDFKRGTGLSSPTLILVWLGMGLGIMWWSWYTSLGGIESYSGNVRTVTADQFDMYVTIDSSPFDFEISPFGFSPLPDIRVGDHVDILTSSSVQGAGYANAEVAAIQSQRGTWIDSKSGGHDVAPYTPGTWPLHEAVRWAALVVGILVAGFGLASLVRWMKQPASGRQAVASGTAADGLDFVMEADRTGDVPSQSPSQASTTESLPPADPSANGVVVGILTVLGSSAVEVIGVMAEFSGCSGYQAFDVMLALATVGLAVGGTATLVLAARGAQGSPQRAAARRWGIVGVVIAVISLPINVLVIGLSGFCAVG